jgi:hypothetical protein
MPTNLVLLDTLDQLILDIEEERMVVVLVLASNVDIFPTIPSLLP